MNPASAPLPIPSPDWALFLDFDGTLVDIAATPSAIEVPAELPGILQRLRRALNGAVALVSGRALGDLDHFVGALDLPAAGQHGAEMRMADGIVHAPFGRNGVAPFLADIEAFAAARPGLLVENKGASVALHYRQAPRYRDEVPRFLGALASRTEGRLETMTGHGVVEIKPRGANKGRAVNRFMEVAPFAGFQSSWATTSPMRMGFARRWIAAARPSRSASRGRVWPRHASPIRRRRGAGWPKSPSGWRRLRGWWERRDPIDHRLEPRRRAERRRVQSGRAGGGDPRGPASPGRARSRRRAPARPR
jgi:trehalose 6-phosphate phosphatase